MTTNFPKLPFGLIPTVIIKHGNRYYCFCNDGNVSHKFVWDGISVSFNRHDIAPNYPEE